MFKTLIKLFFINSLIFQFAFASSAEQLQKKRMFNDIKRITRDFSKHIEKEMKKSPEYKESYLELAKKLRTKECKLGLKKNLTMVYRCGKKFVKAQFFPGKTYFLLAGKKLPYSLLKNKKKYIQTANAILKSQKTVSSILLNISDLFIPRAHAVDPDIVAAVLGIGLVAGVLYSERKWRRARKEDNVKVNSPTTAATTPATTQNPAAAQPTAVTQGSTNLSQIPVGNWAYIDDSVTSLDKNIKGDPNSSQDLALVLALAVEFNSLPRFIGVTHVDGALGTSVVKEIVKLFGVDIPIVNGAGGQGAVNNGHPAPSELSRAIANESKKGKFHLAVGGTTGDIATAIKSNGANTSNLITYITPSTFNESISGGGTAYVLSKVRNVVTSKDHLWWMLGTKKGPKLKIKGKSPAAWVNQFRDIPMFDRAFSKGIMNGAAGMNSFMHEFENGNPFRMADFLHVTPIFGVKDFEYQKQVELIESGLKKIRAAQK